MSEYWYYWCEYVGWTKVKYRPDWSGVDDVFEHITTCQPYYRKGMRLSVEYGCLDKLLERGDFMTEEDFNIRKPSAKILTKL